MYGLSLRVEKVWEGVLIHLGVASSFVVMGLPIEHETKIPGYYPSTLDDEATTTI
jgi:hypothetical protein